MTDIEAIKAKLLAKQYYFGDRRLINPDGPEAVAVIDALVADNERLREMMYDMVTVIAGSQFEGFTAFRDARHELLKEFPRAALKDATRD